MPQVKEGTVTVVLPDTIELPAEAGHLGTDEVRRIPKARRGIGLAAAHSAVELTKRDGEFSVPGVAPEELAKVGAMAEEIDTVIADLEVLLHRLKQANLLIDARALELLGRVNDQVQVLGKRDPSLLQRFGTVLAYFANKRSPAPAAEPQPEPN